MARIGPSLRSAALRGGGRARLLQLLGSKADRGRQAEGRYDSVGAISSTS